MHHTYILYIYIYIHTCIIYIYIDIVCALSRHTHRIEYIFLRPHNPSSARILRITFLLIGHNTEEPHLEDRFHCAICLVKLVAGARSLKTRIPFAIRHASNGQTTTPPPSSFAVSPSIFLSHELDTSSPVRFLILLSVINQRLMSVYPATSSE